MPPVAEVLFLNYTNPSNDDSACQIRHAAMSSVLGMLGLTPNFIEELKLPEKRAIIFLASYAVDWRSCPQEYDDITLCFSRKSRREKVMISGLEDVNREPLDYARHILFTRIQPNIRALRRQSHQINISISTVAPLGVAAPQPADPPPNNTVATVSGNSPSPSQLTPGNPEALCY
ncbi:hypothetical protein NUW58_g3448 [Xylaria curta]|uniref:Uncharacterized protein n=1 Tax=Xylaria curta TaxID=42375 RepID=A0ACC1PCF9_9PEZI|nr:hypothetical protein NUW58_g3448 [Xylaria curta]